MHERLRTSVGIARDAIDDDPHDIELGRDLLLYCWGFCQALDGHHRSEDTALFPMLLDIDPGLAEVVATLKRDHSMLNHLIGAMQQALQRHESADQLHRHLDGIEAVMQTHFGYEERQLRGVLERLDPGDVGVARLLGPLA
ncbi:hemerythrin domain-containing protein [Aeromicrobium sp. CF3.5]|uniref:hemerythrin domain-containing protein n=1 Tax=Aeromicrobium sp. CF3.5 TaxID=3373078 RepID=UPI003EE5B7CF